MTVDTSNSVTLPVYSHTHELLYRIVQDAHTVSLTGIVIHRQRVNQGPQVIAFAVAVACTRAASSAPSHVRARYIPEFVYSHTRAREAGWDLSASHHREDLRLVKLIRVPKSCLEQLYRTHRTPHQRRLLAPASFNRNASSASSIGVSRQIRCAAAAVAMQRRPTASHGLLLQCCRLCSRGSREVIVKGKHH